MASVVGSGILTDEEVALYLVRVGVSLTRPSLPATLETLKTLQRAQYFAIPFETLSIHYDDDEGRDRNGVANGDLYANGASMTKYGRAIAEKRPQAHSTPPISPALPRIFHKLVSQRRGGYCIEGNTLMLGVLRNLGFRVRPVLARAYRDGVWHGLTHMVLLVQLPVGDGPVTDSDVYMVDVGYGYRGPVVPLALSGGAECDDSQGSNRITVWTDATTFPGMDDGFAAPGQWGVPPLYILEWKSNKNDRWLPMYAFYTTPITRTDIELSNWYSCTHPSAHWVNNCTVKQQTTTGAHIYNNGKVHSYNAAGELTLECELLDHTDRHHLFNHQFGLSL
ncbi:hypothetical protein HDU86_004335 [Geranomyces michiganensis]|nr:hypothetical protein HDU86_004335 [Geranomyces michiganensis]